MVDQETDTRESEITQIARETIGEYIHDHEDSGEPYSDAINPMLEGLLMSNNWMMPEKTTSLVLLFKDWIDCYNREINFGSISVRKTAHQRIEAFSSAIKMLESIVW